MCLRGLRKAVSRSVGNCQRTTLLGLAVAAGAKLPRYGFADNRKERVPLPTLALQSQVPSRGRAGGRGKRPGSFSALAAQGRE